MNEDRKRIRRSWVRWLLGALAVLLAVPLLLAAAFLIANRTNGTIESGDQTRRYLLYVPDTYDPGSPAPLVISIHGFAEWPAHQMQISGWDNLADEHGFLLVLPAGTGFPLRWSAPGQANSEEDPLRDVQFISDLIDQLEREYAVDPDRIYANGLSNGGGMSVMLACNLADRIAAIGTVAGAYLMPWDDCRPERPVPLIAFHGTDDPIVPFAGGPSRSFDFRFPKVTEWVARAAERNGCSAVSELPRVGAVSGLRYTNCDAGAEVIFYQVEGGGHSWPGGEPLPEWIAGHTNQDVDATRLMWEFFEENGMPAP
jgi:polyhydroxybutyrate depolymerase